MSPQLVARAAQLYVKGHSLAGLWRRKFERNVARDTEQNLALLGAKSGRLDFDQLALDEEALQQGVAITYNINANYNYTAAKLQRCNGFKKNIRNLR